jgi:hypothetical protein
MPTNAERLEGKRYCVFIPYSAKVEGGFIPSVVIADEAGHCPLSGQGEGAAPWVWGPSYDDAQRAAKAYNEKLGLSDMEVAEIVASSMRAGMRGRRAVR